jgi:hypothetical protein
MLVKLSSGRDGKAKIQKDQECYVLGRPQTFISMWAKFSLWGGTYFLPQKTPKRYYYFLKKVYKQNIFGRPRLARGC